MPRTLSEQEYNAIRQRVLANLPDNLDPESFARRFPSDLDGAVAEAENSPVPALSRFGSALLDQMNPISQVEGLYQAVRHPIDTAQSQALARSQAEAQNPVASAMANSPIAKMGGGFEAGQKIGSGDIAGGLGQAAGLIAPQVLALGVNAAVNAIPSKVRAASNFEDVMVAAKDVPVDVSDPGNTALRAMELGERGGSTPRAVTQYVRRVTDPAKGPLTYEESRDWASNISRLSANDYNRMTPTVARQVAKMSADLNASNAQAALKVGKLAEYRAAMDEYRRASQLGDAIQDVVHGAKRQLPVAGAAGAGAWVTAKMLGLLR